MKMSRQMKHKTNEKSSWTKRFSLWLERHRRIGQLLDTSVLFGSMFVSFLAVSFISSPFPNLNYLSPLSFNLILLIVSTYILVLRFSSDKLQKWRYFSWIFIGFNGLLFPLHLLVGLNWLGRRKTTNSHPIISMDPTYAWFPIVSYLFFFFLGLGILLLIIQIEKRRRRRKWNERLRDKRRSNNRTEKREKSIKSILW